MAFLQMDIRTLGSVKRAIEEYCSYQDAQMRQADADIQSMLAVDWLGPDAKEFGQKWAGIHDDDSRVAKFKQSLLEFGNLLASCANEYRAAQEAAIGEAIEFYRSTLI